VYSRRRVDGGGKLALINYQEIPAADEISSPPSRETRARRHSRLRRISRTRSSDIIIYGGNIRSGDDGDAGAASKILERADIKRIPRRTARFVRRVRKSSFRVKATPPLSAAPRTNGQT